MIRYALIVLASLALASSGVTQTTPNSQSTGPVPNIPGDTIIVTKLTAILDLQRCTPGESVEAQTAHDVKVGKEVVLKRGSTILGHVTSIDLASPNQPENMVGIIFDGVKTKNGPPQTIHLVIRALAPQTEPPANSTISGGRGIPGETDHAVTSGGDRASTGGIEPLTTSSVGVSGIPGLRLGLRKAANGQQSSILAWSKGDPRLRKDTQMSLLVVGQ